MLLTVTSALCKLGIVDADDYDFDLNVFYAHCGAYKIMFLHLNANSCWTSATDSGVINFINTSALAKNPQSLVTMTIPGCVGTGLMDAAFQAISARVREPDEGHKLWWEGQPLMTIDSLHEAANKRIDSCFKLSHHGGVAVTKSTSLSLLPAPINRIYDHSREILPFPHR